MSIHADVHTPREVEGLDENVVMISAGSMHSAFLCADGRVWCCGDGRHGVLGNGERGGRRQLTPAAMNVDPSLYEGSPGAESFFFPAEKKPVD